jgi:NADH dehydrogenase FAD-containing subunit
MVPCFFFGYSFSATAQVAAQQGEYLAHLLNAKPITAFTEDLAVNVAKPFSYQHLGSMAYIGGDEAILDFSSGGKLLSALNLAPSAGWGTYWLWRSVYFSELFTTRNRAQLAFDWTRSKLFGRDISRD